MDKADVIERVTNILANAARYAASADLTSWKDIVVEIRDAVANLCDYAESVAEEQAKHYIDLHEDIHTHSDGDCG